MAEQNEMEKIVTSMMEHVCDRLCRFPWEIGDQEEMSRLCCECELEKYAEKIRNEYNRINGFGKRSTGKKDISGQEVFEGDIIESHLGDQVLAEKMVVKYGTYQAYCPVDNEDMDSVGFYISASGLPDMPIGPMEDYAKVVGNIFDNPELLNA